MRTYKITGMSCAGCSARVEKTVSQINGVVSCSVNLLTGSMVVDGTPSDREILSAVKKLGFGINKESKENRHGSCENDEFKDTQTPFLLKKLLLSLGFLVLLMYFSMGYTMWGFPLPSFITSYPIIIALIQMVLALAVMIINKRFFVNGAKGLIRGGANMGTLVSLGSLSSFIYSLVITILMIGKSTEAQAHELHRLHFESAAMTLALITIGKTLEAYSKGKTTNALKALMDLSPRTATIIVDGEERTIDAKDIKAGDIFIVRPGDAISADGIIIEGETTVNESALTGESMPVSKEMGNEVYSATINGSGFIKCRATKSSDETMLAQIIRTVKEASSTKAPVQKIADRVSRIFVPTVILIAVLTTISWIIFSDNSFGYALERGVSVLVISCPCALGLATPVAIMVGSGVGARNGILFKNAASLEEAGKIKAIAIDKTGTITKGHPQVTDIIPYGVSEELLLKYAYSVEKQSEHPLSNAIVKKAEKNNISPLDVSEFKAISGKGIEAYIDNESVYAGNYSFASIYCEISKEATDVARSLANQGKTPLFFVKGGNLIGIIAVADTIKEDSREAIMELKSMNITPYMITGDNELTAKSIANESGIENVIAGVMPNEKSDKVRELKSGGNVAMVGDGINDAPALTSSDVGIAIGSGSDIAIDSADIVITKNTLMDVVTAIRLSRATLNTIKGNLFWAFIYNVIGISLATGMFIPVLGWELNPMFSALAMGLSSFFVVMNALRLNLFSKRGKK